ncbi:hypothetical protein OM076_19050 [Solirubrobacter ginsenosidimutans]|uniref:Uncharacterized protein n=1 Tax=Solirubrobacter ginsenosidimutans TaxID=490573 RepID=A0A9X3MW14_9ACTN|nr:hypothetical protein [Solirubrobacter ginsenosidimutans]MDA0162378.1 hypothetical protein [Solirubrobacter ginsenosidimutans]
MYSTINLTFAPQVGAIRRARRTGLALVALVLAGFFAPGAALAARETACRTTTVSVVAGASATLKLDCRVGSRDRVAGSRGRKATTIAVKPARGSLGKLTAKTGRVVYTAKTVGRDVVRYGLTARDGGRYRGAIVIRVTGRPVVPAPFPAPAPFATPEPTATPTPTPTPTVTPGDGLPEVLPPVPASVASTTRAWVPTAYDTCPAALHDRFSVIGPDGKRYPTWHPPTITNPATGKPCTFGHEHGDDPRTSDIAQWTSEHLAAAGYEPFAGIPFGLAAEALNAWADQHPGTAKRSEDHVGYKVDVANDVQLLGEDGGALGVTCDYLTVVHQGSHSPDALSNNAHELLYATRCTDGTELISTTLSRFGDPGQYERSCDPATRIQTTDNGYPDGDGERLIPDRTCVERNVLVPAGRTTSVWALYEKWTSANTLTTAQGDTLARFDSGFGVFNPSRYANADNSISRTLPLCRETAADGDRADGVDCTNANLLGVTAFDDPRSPFDGTRRDLYLAGTTVTNTGGNRRYWTDPYGGNASTTPFAGGVCQLVSSTGNPGQKTSGQVFGRNKSFDADGVHAPN